MEGTQQVINLVEEIYKGQSSNAEEQLKRLEESQCKQLIEILLFISLESRTLQEPSPISITSSIIVKNIIQRNWMKENKLNKEEKVQIIDNFIMRLVEVQNNYLAKLLSNILSEICCQELTLGNLEESVNHLNQLTMCKLIIHLSSIAKEAEKEDSKYSEMFSGSNKFVLMILQYTRRLLLPLELSIKTLLLKKKNKKKFEYFLENTKNQFLIPLMDIISEKWIFAMTVFTDVLEEDEVEQNNVEEMKEEQQLIFFLSEVCSITLKVIKKLSFYSFRMLEGTKSHFNKIWKLFPEFSGSLMENRKNKRSTMNDNEIGNFIDKQLIHSTKILLLIIRDNPNFILDHLLQILQFYLPRIIYSPSVHVLLSDPTSFECKFIILSLNLFAFTFEVFFSFFSFFSPLEFFSLFIFTEITNGFGTTLLVD